MSIYWRITICPETHLKALGSACRSVRWSLWIFADPFGQAGLRLLMDRHFQVFPELFELLRWEFWFVCSSPVRVVPTPVYSLLEGEPSTHFEGLSNPLTVRHLSVLAALNQPHGMMLTPPSLTEGMFLGRCCLQMWCLEGSPHVYSRFHGGGTLQWWLPYWNLLPTIHNDHWVLGFISSQGPSPRTQFVQIPALGAILAVQTHAI